MTTTFDQAASWLRDIPPEQLLTVTALAVLFGWIGSRLVRHRIDAGRLFSVGSTLILGAVLLTVVLQTSHLDRRLDLARSGVDIEQTVSGGETRVELARDGHFWLNASVNGVETAFLVDTGATFTAISRDLASEAQLAPGGDGFGITLSTANGMVPAEQAQIQSLKVGNIEAEGLDVVVLDTMGETNVLGMNFLSRLAGWRVESGTLILVPNEE